MLVFGLMRGGKPGLQWLGLSRECLVPDDYSPDYIARVSDAPARCEQLTFALCAEGKLAELEGRTNDAAKIYAEGVRLGQKSSHGGIMLCKMVGIACESVA